MSQSQPPPYRQPQLDLIDAATLDPGAAPPVVARPAAQPGANQPPPRNPDSTLEGDNRLHGGTVDEESFLKDRLRSLPMAGEMIGNYKILKQLGRGGMGVVFLAEHTRLERKVALKMMLPVTANQEEASQRFLREAQAIAKLRSDYIVTVYDVSDEKSAIPYFAMEFLHGQTLEQHLAAGTSFAVADILQIARQMATGLADAHKAGLIHRDIKPANVWLEIGGTLSDAIGDPHSSHTTHHAPLRVKILDFGLVRPLQAAHANLTRVGDILGTPHYMSPEQARGKNVDARADLFSLGVVLYHLCTGHLPFQGNNLSALLTALAVDTPQPIQELNPAIPDALVQLVNQLLEKDPRCRPESALAVVKSIVELEGAMLLYSHPASAVRTARISPAPPPPLNLLVAARVPRLILGITIILLLSTALAIPWLKSWLFPAPVAGEPLPIGILHSQTGTMALSERSVIDALQLAIWEINNQGGVLGRPISPVIVDGKSDELVFAREVAKMIEHDKVVTIFGCWTSAARKTAKPVVEKHQNLLVYNACFEGMELSPNILYGGAVPNQQVLPALAYLRGELRNNSNWYLIGTDSVFSHAISEVIKDEAEKKGCKIVGEHYVPRGGTDMDALIRNVVKVQPDLIINTLHGDSNIILFRELRDAGIASAKVPTISFCISEAELGSLNVSQYAGDYFAGNYFESINTPRNHEFIKAFQAKYGADRHTCDVMQTAYYNMHLWAQAVKKAGEAKPIAIRDALKGMTLVAPQGLIEIDAETLHTIQHARVCQIGATGLIKEVFVTPAPIRPEPFPASRSRQQWESYLDALFKSWDNHWFKPAKKT